MRFGILGPLEVVDGDVRREPTAGRQRLLLLSLLVSRGEQVGVDRLVDAVWPPGAALPKDPAAALRTYVTRLRGLLEPEGVGGEATLLLGGPDRYELRLDGHELDAADFEADLAAARAVIEVDPTEALRRIERGLARWRGRAFEEVADVDWARPEAARLEELRLSAQQLWARCLLDTGRHDEAVSELGRQVVQQPLREGPHAQLMLALHRCGRTAEATKIYRTFRARLVDETGLEPSSRLDEVHRHLLEAAGTVTPTDVSASRPALPSLPRPRTALVGRAGQIAAVDDLLSSSRVVTLTGVGGVGKTRLALAVARSRPATGRVLFVDLSALTDAAAVTGAVADALRLPAEARGDPLEGLVRVLRTQPTLLVLDNCEHQRDAVAGLVDRLVGECAELTVLATSRETLGVEGEHVHQVPPLESAAGVELFLTRASAASPAGLSEPVDVERVADICRRLDGIPLAIELAAARTSHMTVASIAAHLDERFWLLADGRRSPGRHQTMQTVMDFSYHLLNEEQQRVLRAASIFVGDFDAAALAAVAGLEVPSTLDHVGALVDSSLVEVDRHGPEARYRLLETVRLYVRQWTADSEGPALRTRHAQHYLRRALAEQPRVTHPSPPAGYLTEWEDEDLANNLTALDWLDRRGELADVGRLAARLGPVLGYVGFLDADGRYVGRDDVVATLEEADERALYLTVSTANANSLGHYEQQLAFGDAALRDATDPGTRVLAAVLLANACTIFDPARIPQLIDDAVRDVPQDAVPARMWLRLRCHEPMGMVAQGRLDDAAERFDELVAEGEGLAAAEVVFVHLLLGRRDRALTVPPPGEVDPDDHVWDYRWELVRALIAAIDGEIERADHHLVAAAERVRAVPASLLDHDVLLGVAPVAYHGGDARRASELMATFRGVVRTPATFALYRHYRNLLKQHLSKEERTAILEQTAGLDPRLVLEQELRERHSQVHAVAPSSGMPDLSLPQ